MSFALLTNMSFFLRDGKDGWKKWSHYNRIVGYKFIIMYYYVYYYYYYVLFRKYKLEFDVHSRGSKQ